MLTSLNELENISFIFSGIMYVIFMLFCKRLEISLVVILVWHFLASLLLLVLVYCVFLGIYYFNINFQIYFYKGTNVFLFLLSIEPVMIFPFFITDIDDSCFLCFSWAFLERVYQLCWSFKDQLLVLPILFFEHFCLLYLFILYYHFLLLYLVLFSSSLSVFLRMILRLFSLSHFSLQIHVFFCIVLGWVGFHLKKWKIHYNWHTVLSTRVYKMLRVERVNH